MNTTVQVALFGWPLVAVAIFAFLPPRRAVLVSILTAWLFLPIAIIEIPGLRYDRGVSCSAGALLGALIFDFRKFLVLKPNWLDIPAVILVFCPIPTSLVNSLGIQDGVYQALHRVFVLGIPFLLGRLYFHSPNGLREIAMGLLVGGLIYMPLCLLEIRLSPLLHIWVYGYHQHYWGQTVRFGGWRPTVFMSHGLEVGMWMASSSLAGVWLWTTGAVKKILNIPLGWWLIPLLGTTVMCKSLGALMLMFFGLAALMLTRWGQTKALLVVLLVCPLLYIGTRAPDLWSGEHLTQAAGLFGEDRAESVHYRLYAEDMLTHHAMRQPVFGWGGWGRNRPAKFNALEPNISIDGLWIITLGSYGFVGMFGLLGTFLLPPLLLLMRLKTRYWSHPWCAPATLLAVVMILFMIDSLLNAMVNPFYLLPAGGLSRAVRAPARRAAAEAASPAPVEGHLGVS